MAHLTKQAGRHVLHGTGPALETAPAQLHGADCKLGSRPNENIRAPALHFQSFFNLNKGNPREKVQASQGTHFTVFSYGLCGLGIEGKLQAEILDNCREKI